MVPLSHMPAQRPAENGAQADPGGNPFRTQSASRLQAAHAVQPVPHPEGTKKSPQKRLPPVVTTQPQLPSLLQVTNAGSGAVQTPGSPWSQVPTPCARQVLLPCGPRQIPEQH